MGPGIVVGDTDAIFDRPYSTTIKCASNSGELYAFSRDEFVRRVKSNDESWTIANKVAVTKEISFIKKKKDQINYEAEQSLRLSLDERPSRRPLSHRGLKHKVLRRGSALQVAK